MIKKLRIKFIFATMFSLFIVFLVIIGSINILNYQNIVEDADIILSVLEKNNGAFPNNFKNTDNFSDDVFSPELQYESRYFSVTFGSDGGVNVVDTGEIAAVDSDTAIEYAKTAYESNKEYGFLDDYRYIVSVDSNEIQVIFLDCRRSLTTFKTFLAASIIVPIIGLLAVLLLIIFLSGRIVKPFSENYEKQKSFITDAGHELKTPLTIIDADADVLEMDIGENEWLNDIKAQTTRLAELTNNLILLSRMDEEQTKEQMIDFPLSDIVEETASSFQALSKTKNKSLSIEIQPMISMIGDEKSIRRLVVILLDNAMKYSPENGIINIKLEKQRNQIRLSVYNTTQHIAKDQIEHLFDRFYRTDRSRNSQTGGYGLGLSIANAIVNAHKGKIVASTQDEKSLLITATFST